MKTKENKNTKNTIHKLKVYMVLSVVFSKLHELIFTSHQASPHEMFQHIKKNVFIYPINFSVDQISIFPEIYSLHHYIIHFITYNPLS